MKGESGITDKSDTVYHPPAKLMRLELSPVCNYSCPFCYWQIENFTPCPFTRDQIIKFCQGLVKTGCKNVNITGGEPLLGPREYLFEIIAAICGVEGINKVWVTTNGSMLYDLDFCRNLAKTGLKEMVVSIAAETDEKYMVYTASALKLSELLKGIATAVHCGIAVRVHIPLSSIGIHSFEQLEILLNKIVVSGVTEVFFFGLHNNKKNAEKFRDFYVDPAVITEKFRQNSRWKYFETETRRPFYTDGIIRVNVPREQIRLVTQNCKSSNCGVFCQGIYSAYCVPDKQGWVLRACHRIFDDKKNEYPLDLSILEDGQESKLYDLLRFIWGYAYEEI